MVKAGTTTARLSFAERPAEGGLLPVDAE